MEWRHKPMHRWSFALWQAAKNTQQGKRFLFNKVSGETGFPDAKAWDEIFILLYTQSQLKRIKNVNVRPEIVKILEDIQEDFMTLVLAMMSWIVPQKHMQWQQK